MLLFIKIHKIPILFYILVFSISYFAYPKERTIVSETISRNPFFILQLHKELKLVPIYDVNLIKIRAIFFYFFPAPSRPRNIQVMSTTDTTIQISWWEPARANGVLQGYRIYMLHQNFTSVQTVRSNKSSMVETLTRLSKYSCITLQIIFQFCSTGCHNNGVK